MVIPFHLCAQNPDLTHTLKLVLILYGLRGAEAPLFHGACRRRLPGAPVPVGHVFPFWDKLVKPPAGSVLGLSRFAAGIGFVPPLVLAIEFRNILCSLSFAWGACGLWETLSRAWRLGFSSSCWFDEVNKVANMSQLPYAI